MHGTHSHTLALKPSAWLTPKKAKTEKCRSAPAAQRGALSFTAPDFPKPDFLKPDFPKSDNEPQRLAALRGLDILDTAPEDAYDEIAELAAQICDCPVAFISFIDDDRRWLKAKYGLRPEIVEAPRRTAVCSTTICGTEVLMVPDMRQDPRFDRSPMAMADPPCRFYCGVPLITDEGFALGALCVMDFARRQLSFEQIESLRRLSRQVLTQLELRRKLIEYDRTINELHEARIEAAEGLLENVLPAAIADELKQNGKVRPKYTRSATILFADFQGFTVLAERTEPVALLALLDRYFSAFDDIVGRYGLEKLKTIGDAYMAVAGVPAGNRRHPIDTCLAALEMQATVGRIRRRSEKLRLPALDLRIGIHTGPVISGVVGNRRFSFDVWGDAVNTASFMEAHGLPGRINISQSVAGHVQTLFALEPRGLIKAKHARAHEMFFLNRLKPEFSRDAEGCLPNDNFAAACNSVLGGSQSALIVADGASASAPTSADTTTLAADPSAISRATTGGEK
jgi:class 3 adenylate cyclase